MEIGEIFKRYIEMENKDDMFGGLKSPLTTRQMLMLYNFNNPNVADAWEDAVSEFVETKVERRSKSSGYVSPSAIGEHKIKVCYL